MTSAYWGLLLSVLYGMNVVAMLFLMRCRTALTRFPFAAAELSLMLSALAWIFYALTQNQRAILAGAAVEGFGGALASTLLVTKMLESSRQDLRRPCDRRPRSLLVCREAPWDSHDLRADAPV